MAATENQTDYESLQEALVQASAAATAAEAHGIMCGMLVSGVRDDTQVVEELLPPSANAGKADDKCRQQLTGLVAETIAGLMDEQLGFRLLLPDSPIPLRERARALQQWSSGFLYGFGLVPVRTPLPSGVQEALSDISEFTRLNTDIVRDTDENEEDFTQLEEYLRVATLLVSAEYQPAEDSGP
ncbi:MAG: UPF0149 family protein [Pseudomonadota bacterium]